MIHVPPSSSQVTINFKSTPTTANAGTDQVICGNSTALTGNNPASGMGSLVHFRKWRSFLTHLYTTFFVVQLVILIHSDGLFQNAPCAASIDDVFIFI
jgi:hypothetical protein